MSAAGAAATLSSQLATTIVSELIVQGVRDFVVCPGSRSQALALAVAEAEALGEARLHVRIDERSAAFFALGIARESGLPAPVIVTSGSAVANLMPAVLEGHSARVPMMLLTADRPEELHGVRASQTVWDNMYTFNFSRFNADVPPAEDEDLDEYLGSEIPEVVAEAFVNAIRSPNGAGPTHLNIAFRDPLSGPSGLLESALERARERGPARVAEKRPTLAERRADVECERCGELPGDCDHKRPTELEVYVHGAGKARPNTVVIAGADAGAEAEAFAHAAGVPLLAEPSSGARFGREAIQHWQGLLNDEELASRIEVAVIFGHPGLTREVARVVAAARTVVVDDAGPDGPALGIERFNPGRNVKQFAFAARVSEKYDPTEVKAWLGEWIVRDRSLRDEHTTVHETDLEAARATGYQERNAFARAEVARMREPVSREHLTEMVWRATWPHDRLVLAASRLIRVLNRMATPRNIRVHSNRGLAGIDGTIATAMGIAQASDGAGITRVLIGDLALFHDVGSLALPPEREGSPRMQLIVGNDGGGTIFDTLEVAATSDPEAFDRVMLTPQRIDIAQLAAAYGWSYRLVTTQGELEEVLTAQAETPGIVEVALAR